ncbi:hypothetical protein [Candidatus Binatus sp.]|uniref:hypothetical protein n=1 Tax=Candidatus Binatus sp. TaxID=2811406 RepID=UPI003BB0728D
MFKRSLMAASIVFLIGCNSGPSQTAENTVGGPNVVSTAQTRLTNGTTSISLDWGKNAQAGQLAVADVVSYGGPKVTITAPAGWQLIREDSTPTTRQSLYWHAIQANDPSTATWTFNEPVDAQGALILLDNVAAASPADMTSGNAGNGGTLTAKSIVTTSDGDLILSFNATDFHLPGLAPQLPADTKALINQEAAPNEFWILSTYQSQNAATEDQVSTVAQLFNWTAAQVAIKKGTATP